MCHRMSFRSTHGRLVLNEARRSPAISGMGGPRPFERPAATIADRQGLEP